MSELNNGRTPEEIKRILNETRYDCDDECRPNEPCNCPYSDDCNCGAVAPVPKNLIYDALALIERLESERNAATAKVPKWISVNERLPESGVHVFALCEIRANGYVIGQYVCDGFHAKAWKEKAGCYSEDCALVYDDEDDEYYLEEGWYEVIKNWEEYNSITIADSVTHWMPLPKPPKEV